MYPRRTALSIALLIATTISAMAQIPPQGAEIAQNQSPATVVDDYIVNGIMQERNRILQQIEKLRSRLFNSTNPNLQERDDILLQQINELQALLKAIESGQQDTGTSTENPLRGAMTPEDHLVTIIQLNHADPRDMRSLLEQILNLSRSGSRIIANPNTASLIVSAPENLTTKVRDLVTQLDVEPTAPTAPPVQSIAVRAYAIEAGGPTEQEGAYKITVQYQVSRENVDAAQIVIPRADFESLARKHNIRLVSVVPSFEVGIVDDSAQGTNITYRLTGITDNPKNFKTMQFEEFSGKDYDLNAMVLEEKRISDNATHIPNVPEPKFITPILDKLLGEQRTMTGYWFGNTTLPGECSVPLGFWQMSLIFTDTNRGNGVSAQNSPFQLQASVFENTDSSTVWNNDGSSAVFLRSTPGTHPQQQPPAVFLPAAPSPGQAMEGSSMIQDDNHPDFTSTDNNGRTHYRVIRSPGKTILRNTVSGRMGQPIIIGYTRNTDSGPRLGALVIIPENDFSTMDTPTSTDGFGKGGGMRMMGGSGMGGMSRRGIGSNGGGTSHFETGEDFTTAEPLAEENNTNN